VAWAEAHRGPESQRAAWSSGFDDAGSGHGDGVGIGGDGLGVRGRTRTTLYSSLATLSHHFFFCLSV